MTDTGTAPFCLSCLKYHGIPSKPPRGRLTEHQYYEVGATLNDVGRMAKYVHNKAAQTGIQAKGGIQVKG